MFILFFFWYIERFLPIIEDYKMSRRKQILNLLDDAFVSSPVNGTYEEIFSRGN